jgi:hypothetical protein
LPPTAPAPMLHLFMSYTKSTPKTGNFPSPM